MKKGSLRLRLFVAAAISIAAALSLTGFALVRLFEAQVRERVITGLENDLLQLAGSISVADDGTISAGKALSDPRYQEPYGGRYWRIEFKPPPGQAAPEAIQSPSLWDYDLDATVPVGPEGEALVFARRDLSIDRNGKPLRTHPDRRGPRGRGAAADRRAARPAYRVARHHRLHPRARRVAAGDGGPEAPAAAAPEARRHPHRPGKPACRARFPTRFRPWQES